MIDPAFAVELADAHPTPLYAYDLDEVDRRADILIGGMPEGGAVLFSLKSNPLSALGKALCAKGARGEVCSEGELESAIEAGFVPGDMLFSGPGKTPCEIKSAISKGVRRFSCESWVDLDRVVQGALAANTPIDVLLRINPAASSSAALQMSGVASQFGFEEDDVKSGGEKLKALPTLVSVKGLHIYYGTQISGEDGFTSAAQEAIACAERVAEALDMDFEILDIGGGFAWPFTTDGEGSNMEWFKATMDRLSKSRKKTANAAMWVESGRYLVAASGSLVLRVLDVKDSKDNKRFVVLDGGINTLGGMSGLGRIARVTSRFERMNRRGEDDGQETYEIVGPLCSPLDTLARNVLINKLEPNDVIAIPNVGAYGLSASLVFFLSRPLPLEIAYRDNRIVSITSSVVRRELTASIT